MEGAAYGSRRDRPGQELRGKGGREKDWWEKVTGRAKFAAEYAPGHLLAYAVPVQSEIARGEVVAVDCESLLTLPGMLAVLWYGNAPGLGTPDDPELDLFQTPEIAHRGQFVAAVVAESLETAHEAARRIQVEYAAEPHDVALRPGHPRAYRPPDGEPAETGHGNVEQAMREAAVSVDLTYTSPAYHHNPLEPDATVAVWENDGLILYDSCPQAETVRDTLARLFALPPALVRVVSPHVGVGFVSGCATRPQTVLAAMAAKVTGRPVKVVLTRGQMFAVSGYRTPLVQRVRLAADAGGRLTAAALDAVEQTSTLKDPGEPVMRVSRLLYSAPNRRRTHEIVPLDVPTPSWLRAHGEFPGLFALESAMDELAVACGLDPIELRVRNRPETTGEPPESHGLVACLREGAERFGWAGRDPAPGVHRDGRWLVGTGVAAAAYPVPTRSAEATAHLEADGRYRVRIAAAGLRADERDVLEKIAADALHVAPERVRIEVCGGAPGVPNGSAAIWGPAVERACEALVELLDEDGAARGVGLPREATVSIPSLPPAPEEGCGRAEAGHAFGAQFAQARVDVDTGEVRVPRLLGVFAVGRVTDPGEARSRLVGAMTLGLSMTLFEHSVLDERFGDFLNRDLSRYLVATSADVGDVEACWIEGAGPDAFAPDVAHAANVAGLGVVGTAAAIANAVYHATGVRVRDLPIRLDRLLDCRPALTEPASTAGRTPY